MDDANSSSQSNDSDTSESSDPDARDDSDSEGLDNVENQRASVTGVTMDAANTSLLVMRYPLKGFNGVREHSLFCREHKLRTKCIHYLFHIGFASAEVEAIMGKKNNVEAIKTLLRPIDCLLNSGVDGDEVLNVLSQSRGAKMLELINEN